MNRAYNIGERLKTVKKVSNFEDHAENFYSDKPVHFYNMRFHAAYSAIDTLQRNRALFLISTVFWKIYELL
jgi:hypothetical protein